MGAFWRGRRPHADVSLEIGCKRGQKSRALPRGPRARTPRSRKATRPHIAAPSASDAHHCCSLPHTRRASSQPDRRKLLSASTKPRSRVEPLGAPRTAPQTPVMPSTSTVRALCAARRLCSALRAAWVKPAALLPESESGSAPIRRVSARTPARARNISELRYWRKARCLCSCEQARFASADAERAARCARRQNSCTRSVRAAIVSTCLPAQCSTLAFWTLRGLLLRAFCARCHHDAGPAKSRPKGELAASRQPHHSGALCLPTADPRPKRNAMSILA